MAIGRGYIMKYLNPFQVHGLKPFPIPGYENQQFPEPVEDDVEKIREEITSAPSESICPACDLGGCMIAGVSGTKVKKENES